MYFLFDRSMVWLLRVGFYHYAVGEAGDEGVFNGDGGEVNGADVAGKDLSEGAEGVLWDEGEDGGAGEVPELLRLGEELSGEVAGAGDRSDVIGFRREDDGGVRCVVSRREKWVSLVLMVLHREFVIWIRDTKKLKILEQLYKEKVPAFRAGFYCYPM